VTRYDRVIPPGGTGQITLGIDTSRVREEFQKKALVWSNDPVRKSVALYLTGEVKPMLEIINNHEQPFKITGVDNDLPDHIKWHLEEIKPGYAYTLEVEDISKKAGEFSGHLIVRTDQPQKPELVIIVNEYIKEK
jgi:hypothetical protein